MVHIWQQQPLQSTKLEEDMSTGLGGNQCISLDNTSSQTAKHMLWCSQLPSKPNGPQSYHQWESMHVPSHGITLLWDLHCQQWEFHILDKVPNRQFSIVQSFTDGVRRVWAPTSPGCFCWATQKHANVNQHANVKLILPSLNHTISQLSRTPVTCSSAQHLHTFNSALACLSPFSS